MDTNQTNQENDDDKSMCGMRKIINLQKYGVKSFPYRGRRRYTPPSIYQSLDGGIVITNDVFGLTIRQFDRVYKNCLDRRKTKEQWILNLRYPNKASNAYMEYLQNCVYYNKDNMTWPGNCFKEKYFYEHLVYTVGTEISVRNRQRLSIINDLMYFQVPEIKKILSGSLAEGLDLPGSDKDEMVLLNDVDVIQNARNVKHLKQDTIFLMESDNDYPGFAKLRLIATGEKESKYATTKCCESTPNGLYLSIEAFIDNLKTAYSHQLVQHGPSLSDTDQNFDIAFCLRSKSLPSSAIPWITRHRHQWPPNFIIDKIQNYGCLVVAIGPKSVPKTRLLWRLSFSVAEKQLVHSFNFTQLLCYGLLKLTMRRIINTDVNVKELLCSYFLKTALFWVSEEVDIETFQLVNLFYCFFLCLDKLIIWTDNCYCPNYFIPKCNMFLGRIDQRNNKNLQIVLLSIKCGGIDKLINNLFPTGDENDCLLKKRVKLR